MAVRLKKTFIFSDNNYKAPGKRLQANANWQRLTLNYERLKALEHVVKSFVKTKLTAVVVYGFNNLLAVVQLLKIYILRTFDVNGFL